jgi:ubiquinone/menaquinone biosynthesis C-methylase UbiE
MQTLSHALNLTDSPVEPGTTAVVIGRGAVFLALTLSPLVRKILCLDRNSTRLASAERALSALDNVGFRLIDSSSLPVPSESADMVFALEPLDGEGVAGLPDLVRTLRPGGRLYLAPAPALQTTLLRQVLGSLGLDAVQEVGIGLPILPSVVHGRKPIVLPDPQSAALL